jgi:endoglucanase
MASPRIVLLTMLALSAIGLRSPTPAAAQAQAQSPTPRQGVGDFPRRYHVDGNSILDQYFQKSIFRGIATCDPAIMTMKNPVDPVLRAEYFREAARWGATILRIPITPYSLHKLGLEDSLRCLDRAVEWAGTYRMYVIVDFHCSGWFSPSWFDIPESITTIEEWTAFWEAVSSRYAGNDVVAVYEIFNEPCKKPETRPYTRSDWMTWKAQAERLINGTIRPRDPRKIVLVGGIQNSFDLEYAIDAPIHDDGGNLAYAIHPYPVWTEPTWDTAFGKASERYAVIATELGYQDANERNIVKIRGVPYRQALIDYLEARGIGWTVWSFTANWPGVLLKDNATFEPSEPGAYYRDLLLRLNGEPSRLD